MLLTELTRSQAKEKKKKNEGSVNVLIGNKNAHESNPNA